MYSLVLMAALSGSASAPATWGCHGCHGCYSCGCYSYSCGCYSYGCGGCWSSCGCYSYRGCYSCGGCWSPYAGCYSYGCCGSGVIVKPMPAGGVGAPPAGGPMPPPVKKEDEANSRTAPAYLVVNLPAEAKLTIDNAATSTTTASRRFVSPALERGKDFIYNLKAEMMRDGTAVTTTKQVTVRAGETTQVTLEFAATTVTLK